MQRAKIIISRGLRFFPKMLFFSSFAMTLSLYTMIVSSHAYKLTVTGISTCYNDTAQIPCPASGQDFYGQDGNYRMGTALSYAANGDTVTDQVTGLIWQAGNQAGILNWDNAVSYCENINLAGQTDWRLPTRKELLSITDDGRVEPAIDPTFPCVNNLYWAISKDGDPYTAYRYSVDFNAGQWGKSYMSAENNVRCVRGGAIPESVYVNNGDGTVRDSTTGLVWERAGSDANMTWKDALAYCENRDTGGKTEWRLPNKKELETLILDSADEMPISPEFIEPDPGRRYWSGSPYVGPRAESWRVDFDAAKASYYGNLRNYMYYVRCVYSGGTSASTVPANSLLLIND